MFPVAIRQGRRKLPSSRRGFTLVELMVVCLIISILVAIAIGSFQVVKQNAYKVTLRHDLQNFVKAQEAYSAGHGRYLGAAGDYIAAGKPPTGPLAVAGFIFAPSEGVRVEILSGGGQDDSVPLRAAVRHLHASSYYEYDFATQKTTEK